MRPQGPSRFAIPAILALAVAAPPAAPAGIDRDGDEYPEVLVTLATRLDDSLHKTCPEATVALEDGYVVARYRTQVFQVHGIDRTGEIDANPHAERGPNVRGFQLRLNLHDGPVVSAAVVPQDSRRVYWTTFIDAAVLPGKDQWARINLDYGSRTDPKLVEQIKAEVAAWAADQGRPGKRQGKP